MAQRGLLVPLATAALGAVLGFAAASLRSSAGAASSSSPDASSTRPVAESMQRPLQPSAEPILRPPRSSDLADAGATRPEAATPDLGVAPEKDARSIELGTLRAREHAAQRELAEARQRIARLEKEMAAERPPREERTRHEYDLTREDWKKMAEDGVVKFRTPCSETQWAPNDATLAELGLSPDDSAIVKEAYEHSAARQRQALLPLCATALGERMDIAQILTLDTCRSIIFSSPSARSENRQQSARNVASFMAGDAPRPAENAPLTERAFLALVEESQHFEDELAESFGPEEAHRLTFSDRLCFSRSSHSYGSPQSAPSKRDSPSR